MSDTKERLFAYIKEKYHASPEYPWARYPELTGFKHGDNQKLFALVSYLPRQDGAKPVEVVNLKMKDPFTVDFLAEQQGFFHGLIGRGGWVAINLDGSVQLEVICHWLDQSYLATASKQTKQRLRPPKEWIVPANPKYYDVQAAFDREDEINWKQGKGIKTGDTVFLYVAAPVSAILYKCRVTKSDIPYRFDNGQVRMSGIMRIKLQKRYAPTEFTFETLKNQYRIFAVRGPRGIPRSLSEALKR